MDFHGLLIVLFKRITKKKELGEDILRCFYSQVRIFYA